MSDPLTLGRSHPLVCDSHVSNLFGVEADVPLLHVSILQIYSSIVSVIRRTMDVRM